MYTQRQRGSIDSAVATCAVGEGRRVRVRGFRFETIARDTDERDARRRELLTSHRACVFAVFAQPSARHSLYRQKVCTSL